MYPRCHSPLDGKRMTVYVGRGVPGSTCLIAAFVAAVIVAAQLGELDALQGGGGAGAFAARVGECRFGLEVDAGGGDVRRGHPFGARVGRARAEAYLERAQTVYLHAVARQ